MEWLSQPTASLQEGEQCVRWVGLLGGGKEESEADGGKQIQTVVFSGSQATSEKVCLTESEAYEKAIL